MDVLNATKTGLVIVLCRAPFRQFVPTVSRSIALRADQVSIPNHLKPWVDARQRWNLSHMHIQMAREMGMNPRQFGKIANDRQERWKRPLPEFIAHLYVKRFGRMPDATRTIEEVAAAETAKRKAAKMRKLAAAQAD